MDDVGGLLAGRAMRRCSGRKAPERAVYRDRRFAARAGMLRRQGHDHSQYRPSGLTWIEV